MRFHIGFYRRYILLSNALLLMGNFATGIRYTYETELPAICDEIQDGPQELYKGDMNFTYYNSLKVGKVQSTDGIQQTCDTIYNYGYQPPSYLLVQFDNPIRINYLSIIYQRKMFNKWLPYLDANSTLPCKYLCHDEHKYWPLWISIFQCGDPSVKELWLGWKDVNSAICEIQIFTDKTCGNLPQLENGSYVASSAANVSSNSFEIGTNATLQCSELFQPSDMSSTPTTIQCEASGQWSFSNVTCQKITCGQLPQLENGRYVASSAGNVSDNLFEIGTNATLQCSELFQPSHLSSTPTTIQCEMTGHWSFTNVTCQKITCGHLPQLENGSFIIASSDTNVSNYLFDTGTYATLQCSELFQPSDLSSTPTTIQCETSGQWSFTNATCQRIPIAEEIHQYLKYAIPITIVILILIIVAINWIIIHRRKTFNNKEKPQSEDTTAVYNEDHELDDPLYESVVPFANTRAPGGSNTQPQHMFMLKPCDTSSNSRPRDCVSLYESLDARPDIIQHTTNSPNSDSGHEISPIYATPFCEKSTSSEFVINDLYASADQQTQNK